MIRTLDPASFNRIGNDPSVRPWLEGEGALDFSGVVGNPANIALLTPNHDGGYVLVKLDDGLYEAHTLALPSARGRPMAELMDEGFRYLFTATDAVEVCTRVPLTNPRAARWAARAGFRETFRRGGSIYYALSWLDWCLKDRACREEGEAFHALVEAHDALTHDDDPVHDHVVGAAVLGCKAGAPEKALALFNRWAVFAGYRPAVMVSRYPLVVDIGTAILELRDRSLAVLSTLQDSQACRSGQV